MIIEYGVFLERVVCMKLSVGNLFDRYYHTSVNTGVYDKKEEEDAFYIIPIVSLHV